MPRNGSSVYSLPAGNPVISGTVIATTWANTTLTDIATALTNSLSTDGSTASVSLAGKTMAGGTFNGPTVTGVLTLTGGQIAFPAVQVPSAGANVLDDYEEGTWTPVLTWQTAGNQVIAYTGRSGKYTKIGNLCYLETYVETSTFTHTTSVGPLLIQGAPFASLGIGALGPASGACYCNALLNNARYSNTKFVFLGATSTMVAVTYDTTTFTEQQISVAVHTSGINVLLLYTISYTTA